MARSRGQAVPMDRREALSRRAQERGAAASFLFRLALGFRFWFFLYCILDDLFRGLACRAGLAFDLPNYPVELGAFQRPFTGLDLDSFSPSESSLVTGCQRCFRVAIVSGEC